MTGPEVLVNGEARPLSPGDSVASVVAELLPSTTGCAVALNGEVVPRAAWQDTPLSSGDRVELLTVAPGG